jgi:hypothetical protein
MGQSPTEVINAAAATRQTLGQSDQYWVYLSVTDEALPLGAGESSSSQLRFPGSDTIHSHAKETQKEFALRIDLELGVDVTAMNAHCADRYPQNAPCRFG